MWNKSRWLRSSSLSRRGSTVGCGSCSPNSVLVTPGKSYILRVGATFGTSRDPYLSWEVDYSNPYPDGTGGSGTTFFPGYDYVYRLNSEDAAANLPEVTVTPTITPTPIPPPATATVEAAWYRAGIYASANPRTAWLLQVPVGGSLNLFLGYEGCCYFVEEVPGMQLRWTVEPAGNAQIDPETGVLTVDDTADAAPLTVTVTSANGLSKSSLVSVYDPAANPLVGIWREEARLDCQTGAFNADTAQIAEFILTADGRLSVSWEEFEVYVDYVGTYTFDLASGALHLSGQNLNYMPPDFDGDGRFSIDEQGRLILRDIWLGTAPYGGDTPACGHRFVRQ